MYVNDVTAQLQTWFRLFGYIVKYVDSVIHEYISVMQFHIQISTSFIYQLRFYKWKIIFQLLWQVIESNLFHAF